MKDSEKECKVGSKHNILHISNGMVCRKCGIFFDRAGNEIKEKK